MVPLTFCNDTLNKKNVNSKLSIGHLQKSLSFSQDYNGFFISGKKSQHKLPLYLHKPHLCDPGFKDAHTHVVKKIGKSGDLQTECSGCGTEWNGNYKLHWMPRSVGVALANKVKNILLHEVRGGYVFLCQN